MERPRLSLSSEGLVPLRKEMHPIGSHAICCCFPGNSSPDFFLPFVARQENRRQTLQLLKLLKQKVQVGKQKSSKGARSPGRGEPLVQPQVLGILFWDKAVLLLYWGGMPSTYLVHTCTKQPF